MPMHDSPGEDSDAELEQDHMDRPRTARYLAHLQEHMNQTNQHLLGHDPARISLPSFFAPNSFWTSEEKDKFFRGLSVHSRLRPDLIAEDIGSKTLADICVYLDMLDESLKNPDSLSSSSGLKFVPLPRKEFPVAHEVSQDWVDYEDKHAASAISLEPSLTSQGTERRRADEIMKKRTSIRAVRGAARTANKQRDREGERARKAELEDWIDQKQSEWDAEDTLECLTGPMLRTIDSILREDEESCSKPQDPAQGSRQGSILAQHVADMKSSASREGVAESSNSMYEDAEDTRPSVHDSSSSLLARLNRTESAGQNGSIPEISSAASQSDTIFPATPPSRSSTTLLEPSEIGVQGTTVEEAAAAQLAEAQVPLSPASRRRLHKRLYMRRKRAEKNGQAADQSIARLKPGRKSKPRKSDLSINEDQTQDGSEAETVERDVQETRHSHISGKTLPYKIRELFDYQGLDAGRLRQEGLGLFHMTGLCKLMRTYNGLHDVAEEVNSEITTSTIRTLHEHVVEFTSWLVQQTIVSREQEMFAKTQTKAWRFTESQVITATNVAHALSLFSGKSYDKKVHFENLLERLDIEADSDAFPEEDILETGRPSASSSHRKTRFALNVDCNNSDEVAFEDDGWDDKTLVGGLPLTRIVHPPYVRLPRGSKTLNPMQSLHSYIPWTSGDPTDAVLEEEDLMSSDTNEEELQGELDEDDELDTRDHEQDDAHEKSLWRIFEPSSDDEDRVAQVVTKRKRRTTGEDERSARTNKRSKARVDLEMCEPRGRVKTATYILDSD